MYVRKVSWNFISMVVPIHCHDFKTRPGIFEKHLFACSDGIQLPDRQWDLMKKVVKSMTSL